jgi:hypothetical protein
MTTFDRQIAPLLVRLTRAEQNEVLLAERAKSAGARSIDVGKSIELLAGQFPDVEVRDPLDGQWLLEPTSPLLRERWSARRRIIVETECPALANAAESSIVAAGSIEVQRSSLVQRTEAARRGQSAHSSVARATTGWRRLFRRLMQRVSKKQPSVAPSVNVDEALKRVTKLAEASHRIGQQQMEFQALGSELQRVKQLLDGCDAHLMK